MPMAAHHDATRYDDAARRRHDDIAGMPERATPAVAVLPAAPRAHASRCCTMRPAPPLSPRFSCLPARSMPLQAICQHRSLPMMPAPSAAEAENAAAAPLLSSVASASAPPRRTARLTTAPPRSPPYPRRWLLCQAASNAPDALLPSTRVSLAAPAARLPAPDMLCRVHGLTNTVLTPSFHQNITRPPEPALLNSC